MQAEFLEINLCYSFKGFGNSFKICTDRQRIQQILLNLQSNALKFTRSGGKVEIICSLIRDMDDLEFPVHQQFFEAAKHGMIQVKV